MPYRNVIPSIIWTLIRARRRHVEDETPTDAQALEAIWIPPDFGPNGKRSGGNGDLPMHTWRAGSGVSNR